MARIGGNGNRALFWGLIRQCKNLLTAERELVLTIAYIIVQAKVKTQWAGFSGVLIPTGDISKGGHREV
jgi:hypothetical protein